jgi:phosphatidylglycerophosphatase A
MGPRNGNLHHQLPMPLGLRLSVLIATGGYTGYLPRAPGTAGSIIGLGIGWVLSRWALPIQVAVVVGLFLLGVSTSSSAERGLGIKDHKAIVIDEIVGMALALLGVPLQVGYVVAAFCLFRLLDIVKPIAVLERLPGGWGVMCDDVAAALLTNLVLQGVHLTTMR